MNNDLNFLTKLQNHEVKPPAMLFDAVKQRIAQEHDAALNIKLKGLSTFTKAPPLFLENAIKINLASKNFILIKGIQPVKAPVAAVFPLLHAATLKKLLVKSTDKKIFTLSNFRKYAIPVAACLLFAFAALIDNINTPVTSSRFDESFVINLPVEKETIVNNDQSLATIDVNKKTVKIPRILKGKNIVKVVEKESLVSNELLSETMLVVNGIQLKFIDNDFFATFASFNTVTTDFLNNIPEGKDQTVRLNNYSSIVITVKMQAMMKKMYKTKKNGKIPNSAKKVQKKLLEWKQSDNKNFDVKFKKNPLDPIDLFDFLIDN